MHRLRNFLLPVGVTVAALATAICTWAGALPQEGGKKFPKAEWVDSNRNEPSGTKYQTFKSKVLDSEVSYLVWLPPGYEDKTDRYPVIYWLHGMGGNQRGGASVFVPHVDKAIKDGALPPVIVVCVNGMVTSWYCDWANGKQPIESVIIKDLIPHIDARYRTIAQREARVVQGFSMGGYGAAHLGFKYPDLFGTVVADAGAMVAAGGPKGSNLAELFKDVYGDGKEGKERFLAENPFELAAKNLDKIKGKMLIRIGCGKDDNLLARNEALHETLQKLEVDHQFEVVPGVAHNSGEYYKTLGTKGFEIHKKAFESVKGK
jgi:endo-1,4-beta-xylanase